MPKKRFKTEIRHDQIALAALEIVRDGGVRALNLAAVARRVDIVPSAVYRHYKNKGEIVDAVLRLIQTRLNANFQDVATLDAKPIDKLQILLTRHLELIRSNSAIPRIVFSEEVLAGMPDKRRQLLGIIRDVIRNVSSIVIEGQNRGEMRRDLSPENIAVSFLGMIQPAAVIWDLSDGAFDLARHGRQAWRLFSDALRSQPLPTGDAGDSSTTAHGRSHEHADPNACRSLPLPQSSADASRPETASGGLPLLTCPERAFRIPFQRQDEKSDMTGGTPPDASSRGEIRHPDPAPIAGAYIETKGDRDGSDSNLSGPDAPQPHRGRKFRIDEIGGKDRGPRESRRRGHCSEIHFRRGNRLRA
ncbi:TetR/AcrR family transcriptional regulator [Desulfococcus sp.]|uniref:TetR/AcrR family transcriptional regulator n=1 Tax=Desulfococcus sp. TaxID=2025834 RepID=UPI003593211D